MQASDMSDEIQELVARFSQGDLDAFSELIAKFRKRIYYVAYQMMGNHLDADALLGAEGSKQPVEMHRHKDATRPDMDLSATIAAQDQFEAAKLGEANDPSTYTRYSRKQLEGMKKKELLAVGKKASLALDKKMTNRELVEIIIKCLDVYQNFIVYI